MLKQLFVTLLIILSVSVAYGAEREVIVQIKDPRGDDRGAGDLLYPEHAVYVPGLFDLLKFELSQEDGHICFDFQFATLTNPFGSPEGYFHQRLEVYIRTGTDLGHREMEFGQHILYTHPDLGWDLRLSLAPFGESRLYQGAEVLASGETLDCFVLPDEKTIRLKVPSSLLPHPDHAWGYYVLVGAFDGLAKDFWRDLGEGIWQGKGEGGPVFGLLVPRFSLQGQSQQLGKGILYPVYKRQFEVIPWFAGGLALVVVGFFLWRWTLGRT